jgi:hypothetical protein
MATMNPFLLLELSSGDLVSASGEDLTHYSDAERKKAGELLATVIDARHKGQR